MNASEINAVLATSTIVKRLEFTTNLQTGRCSVILELVDDDHLPTEGIVVEAEGVSGWSVQGFGGGVTQLMCLRVRDVTHLQHDRTRFVLEDLENQAYSLKCEALTAKRLPVH